MRSWIDQSFVQHIATDPNACALITAIVAMASSLRLAVIAEGVETMQEAQLLRSQGCAAAQGYYFSHALPAAAFIELLNQ
jgi:EAL domain-containing protein (putative c-di-GMP-specific phosphodiesterase class I)